MRYPKFLKENGTLGFVAPSFGCAIEPYHSAFKKATYIDKEGNKVIPEGPNAYKFEAFLFDAFGELDDMVVTVDGYGFLELRVRAAGCVISAIPLFGNSNISQDFNGAVGSCSLECILQGYVTGLADLSNVCNAVCVEETEGLSLCVALALRLIDFIIWAVNHMLFDIISG